jgi:hypothetical protein
VALLEVVVVVVVVVAVVAEELPGTITSLVMTQVEQAQVSSEVSSERVILADYHQCFVRVV